MIVTRATSCAAVAVALACSAAKLHAQLGTPDVLFGVRTQGATGTALVRIDRTGGIETWASPELSYLSVPAGMSQYAGRLLVFRNNLSTDSWRRVHPSNASLLSTTPAGFDFNSGTFSFDVHPLTGRTYAVWNYDLYTTDPQTGALQLIGPVTGLASGDGITTLSIDSMGWTVGMGSSTTSGLRTCYSLDLATGHASTIGQVMWSGNGYFRDSAFSHAGELWASFRSTNGNNAISGLYCVDLGTLAATLVRQMNDPYWALAFATPEAISEYCTSKTNSALCPPWISSDGWASPTANSGFVVRAHDALNQTVGMLLHTTSGRAAYPFGGGTMCLGLPRRRTPLQSSGGSPSPYTDCSGAWSLDLNAFLWTQPALPAGTTLQCQWMGRDPGFAPPANYQLSDALELTLNP